MPFFGRSSSPYKSRLWGMITYWSLYFILPSKVTKQIERCYRPFCGSARTVKLEQPKSNGKLFANRKKEVDLGLKNIVAWNQACIAKISDLKVLALCG